MFLVSSAKTTILTDFNDLSVKSTYPHTNGENTDFQFYTQQRIFVEVNKKSGLEIMRVKEKAQQYDLQRVRKLTIDNVYCVACARQSLEEMAVGLANGQVRLYNYKKSEFVHKFNADSSRNSVLYLDYNASDEYIASVFENGSINIYGHRTKTKMESFNIDGNSTLARFHPTKRFQLSIASYKGAVTIYDVHSNRKIFHAADAHAAQCRDLCMTPANPDTLISVGYDCTINIFDTRRKVKPVQLTYSHPLSSVAASECGIYMCVGNLKGELTTYDLRNTKTFLSSKKIHEGGVNRVAFVPVPGENGGQSFSSVGDTSGVTVGNKSITPTGGSENPRSQRDSFCDFLDFHAIRGQEKTSPRFLPRRDSFDWEAFNRKPDDSRGSYLPKGGGGGGSNNNSAIQNESFDLRSNATDVLKVPLRDRSNTPQQSPLTTGKLSQIQEEEKVGGQDSLQNITPESDKENPQIDLDFVQSRLKTFAKDLNKNSTPYRTSMDGILAASNRVVVTSTAAPDNSKQQTVPAVATGDTNVVHQALTDLRREMLERLSQLEFDLKLQIETNKWQMFTQNFNLWNQRSEQIDDIRDCLGILLQTDPFVSEFFRVKEENEMLKQQLQQLTKE